MLRTQGSIKRFRWKARILSRQLTSAKSGCNLLFKTVMLEKYTVSSFIKEKETYLDDNDDLNAVVAAIEADL